MSNHKIKQFSFILISFFLFVGCGTAIKLSDYKATPMKKTKYMPSLKVLENNQLPKVIITDIDNNNITLAQQSSLGSAMANEFNSILSNAKSVDIIKRVVTANYEKILSQEIAASELSKELGTDVGQADFIITGKLSNATYKHIFTEGMHYIVTKKNGKKEKRYSPPSMKYYSCVSGNLKILELPNLKESNSISFEGCNSMQTDVRGSWDFQKRNDSLVRDAGLRSAQNIQNSLKNFFSKKGYIYEMKNDGDKIIIKTMLGSNYGAKEGEDVVIYSIKDSINTLTNKTIKTDIKIAKGVISNQITQNSSWIIIDKIFDNKKIQMGDFVKIKYNNDIW
jgi:DNA-binding transcriptional ArsR family regulator